MFKTYTRDQVVEIMDQEGLLSLYQNREDFLTHGLSYEICNNQIPRIIHNIFLSSDSLDYLKTYDDGVVYDILLSNIKKTTNNKNFLYFFWTNQPDLIKKF